VRAALPSKERATNKHVRLQTASIQQLSIPQCSVCFRIGKAIGTRPFLFLLLSLGLCLACSLGLLFWKEEVDDVQLFMPVDSHVRRDAAWVERNFRDEMRFESVIVEAENVLTPTVLASVS
jgi:hypothetical protein